MKRVKGCEEFPGNNAVCISYEQLKIIIDQIEPTWYGALSNNKGVYLITDTSNGKNYVGSAQGTEAIWQRWTDYVINGHGGNKELEALLKEKGTDYRKYFQYTVLEIADMMSPDEFVRTRESYWMNVLKSREFGYNYLKNNTD